MIKAVFDSTILVSAFVSRNGSAGLLVWQARFFPFQLLLSEELIEETQTSLLHRAHLRRRFNYNDTLVAEYINRLRSLAVIVTDWPVIQIVRDPNDDFVLATAIKGGADYLVTRDKDLLSISRYQTIEIINPADFLHLIRTVTTEPTDQV